MKHTMIGLGLLVLFTGCTLKVSSAPNVDDTKPTFTASRFEDKDVVCYTPSFSHGIWCMKKTQP